MRDYSDTNNIPREAGLYCLLGKTGNSTYEAYVSNSKDVRKRIEQHLILRNSSISTILTMCRIGYKRIVLDIKTIYYIMMFQSSNYRVFFMA
jgi:hypothetical protein